MKKMRKCFAISVIFPIFAPAILEKKSGNVLLDILHDRLTSLNDFELITFKLSHNKIWTKKRN